MAFDTGKHFKLCQFLGADLAIESGRCKLEDSIRCGGRYRMISRLMAASLMYDARGPRTTGSRPLPD